jgi:precorrin-6B methylase 2
MNQAIQAIAIDDEPKALEVIQIHAEKVPFLELKAMFTNAFEALDYLRTNQVDLIFWIYACPILRAWNCFLV